MISETEEMVIGKQQTREVKAGREKMLIKK